MRIGYINRCAKEVKVHFFPKLDPRALLPFVKKSFLSPLNRLGAIQLNIYIYLKTRITFN